MPQPAPSFPAFDEWRKLSEDEQDALLDRLEAAHRSGSLLKQVVVALLLVAACTAIGMALLAVRP